MKKLFHCASFAAVLCVVSIISGLGGGKASAFSGYGDGNTNPYLITTCEQLQEINDEPDASYALVTHIDCSETSTWNSGAGFEPLGDPFVESFTGGLDGNGFEIRNLHINRPVQNNVALFAYIDGGSVEDLGLVNPTFTGQISVAGIAASIDNNTYVRSSFVQGGTIHASQMRASGFIDVLSSNSEVIDSYSTAAVTSDGSVAGFNFLLENSTVTNSFWDTEASGVLTNDGGGTGRTTAQMKTQSTYTDAGWDFEYEWVLDESINNGYPYRIQYLTDDDYNGDDLPDELQSSISSYVNATTGKRVLIDVGESCEITSDDNLEESDMAEQDVDWEYENGLFDFAGDCGDHGFTTTVTFMYYDVDDEDLKLRKYNENTGEYSEITAADIEVRTINGSTVTVVSYNLTDGGELDMDGLVNGEFTDPAGLALYTGTQSGDSDNDSSAPELAGDNGDNDPSSELARTGRNNTTILILATLIMGLNIAVALTRYFPRTGR